MANYNITTAAEDKRQVAVASLLAAAAITLLKLLVGLAAHSIGLLSEAAHSGLDLIAAAMTVVSVQIASRPADADHPYGHGKFENVSAFVQIFFMLFSAGWIMREALLRIRTHSDVVTLSIWPFIVLALSVAVDAGRSRSLRHAADRHHSPALEADAVHFRTDMYTGTGVAVGLLCVLLGRRLHISWLEYGDSVAALFVAVVILYSTWRLAAPTIAQLTDAEPEQESLLVQATLRTVPGVLSVDRVRVRRSGAKYFVDLTVGMSRGLTFQRSEQLTRDVTEAVQRTLPDSDVVIHTVPRASRDESVFDRVRAAAALYNVAVHDLSVRDDHGRFAVEQHVEVPEEMTLRDAHDFVTRLEADIRRDSPEIATVLTHIESEPANIAESGRTAVSKPIETLLRESAAQDREILDVHDVTARRVDDDRIQVSCHCTLPDDLPMGRVHDIITAVESRVRIAAPQVSRVLIHPEPATDNRR